MLLVGRGCSLFVVVVCCSFVVRCSPLVDVRFCGSLLLVVCCVLCVVCFVFVVCCSFASFVVRRCLLAVVR